MNRVQGECVDGRLRFAGGWLPLPPGARSGPALFRPEDLRLVDAAQAQFSGRVASSFFLGDHTRLVIDAGGDTMIVARVQDRRVFHPGDAVHGAIDAQAVLSLPVAAQ